MTSSSLPLVEWDDSSLVAASRDGDREAFSAIVRRYQSLICALAFSATGNVARSEDVAQDVFIAAWRNLPSLREPGHLRAWLCGIARHQISRAQRSAAREPAHLADPLESHPEPRTGEASPPDQAVSHEEQALLWRALERVPAIYREPLILYYREHRSVQHVAAALDLSEEGVKQRLCRGRALLQDQVLAMVEGTLEKTRPGAAFAVGVNAALPALVRIVSGPGAASMSAGGSAKGAGWLGPVATLASAQLLWFVSSVATVMGLGVVAGWQMNDPVASASERRWAERFWRWLVIGTVAFALPALALSAWGQLHPRYLPVLAAWLVGFYGAAGAPLLAWLWANQQRRRGRAEPALPEAAPASGPKRRLVVFATAASALALAYGLSQSHWHQALTPSEAAALLAGRTDAQLIVDQATSGTRSLTIELPQNGPVSRYTTAYDASWVAQAEARGLRVRTRLQGRDYDVLGGPGRRLGLAAFLLVGAGLGYLGRDGLRRRRESINRLSPSAP